MILGSSSGFGGATAKALANDGYNIVGVHLDLRGTKAAADAVRDEIAATGAQVVFHNVNAADEQKRSEVIAATTHLFDERRAAGAEPFIAVFLHSLAFGTTLSYVTDEEGMREVGMPEHVFQVATGRGETGAALIDEVDMVMFTGSTRTGKKVMERAAQTITPVSLELGGKDPMIVLSDADIERAANSAAYYSMQNGGQTCISVERVYVEAPVYDEFVKRLTDNVKKILVDWLTKPDRPSSYVLVRTKEYDLFARDLAGLADSAHRHEGGVAVRVTAGPLGEQRRLDRAGADRVDAHAPPGVVQRGRLGHAGHRVLAGDVE